MRASELERMTNESGWFLKRAVRSGSKSVFLRKKPLKRPKLHEFSSDRVGEWSDRCAYSRRRERSSVCVQASDGRGAFWRKVSFFGFLARKTHSFDQNSRTTTPIEQGDRPLHAH